MRKQEELAKEVESRKEQIDELDLAKTTLNQRIVKLESELMKEKEAVQKKQHQIETLQEENVKFERNTKLFDAKKQNLDDTIKGHEASIEALREQKQKVEAENDALKNNLSKVEEQFLRKKTEFDIKSKEYERLENFNEQCKRENGNLQMKRNDLEVEIGECKSKLREYEKKIKDLSRLNNGLVTDKDRITREKKDAEHEKEITTSGVNALTREIEYLRKQTDQEKTNILNLIRDRDMMSKYIKKAEDENYKNKDEIAAMKNEIA